jgi:hypothetical protein
LFDLWIDAAEEAYAEVALSPEFRAASGARVNAQMRLRQAVQGEIERTSALFGMPTRSDLDAAFRKIADLERVLRALRDQVQSTPTGKSGATARKPATAAPVGGSGQARDSSRSQHTPSAGTAAAASSKAAARPASAKAGSASGASSKGASAKDASAKGAPAQSARAKASAKSTTGANSTSGKRAATTSAQPKGGKR